MTLAAFRDFGAALHGGRRPYLWQTRAAEELTSDGWWPAVRAPTGSGKTTLVDCWLHAVAVAGPERLGRRLVWVVDRRSVVDQIYDYATAVVQRLVANDAPEPVASIARALREYGGGAPPRAVLWRGGLDDEGAIAMRDPLDPAAVAIIVSTVDQLGSRLLFRGYGLGNGSRALHAGLLGVDTTVVLDEAHISEPLRRTVARIGELQRAAPAAPRPAVRLCAVSATHSAAGAFELRPDELQESAIANRIEASKPARLAPATRTAQVVNHVATLAGEGATVIGVVMNTVGAARTVFESLSALAPRAMTDRILLIGPVRPLERLDILPAIPDAVAAAGRESPFVVVATQTIEVGVDLDFDALVTECAPFDALVQRFGRLNRTGRAIPAPAFILPPPARGCPVYGATTASTWQWLSKVAAEEDILDFGVAALRETLPIHGAPPPPEDVRTIQLLAEHLAALQITDATDDEGPAVELFLHGDRAASPQVSLTWRRLPRAAAATREGVSAELDLRPLHPGEAVGLSFAAARRWLRGEPPGFESDLEAAEEDPPPRPSATEAKPAWRVDPQGDVQPIDEAHPLRPGDRVVLDASAGGLDAFGWSPSSTAAVVDLGSISGRAPRVVLGSHGDDEDAAALHDEIESVIARLEAGEINAGEAAAALAPGIAVQMPSCDRGSRPRLARTIEVTRDRLRKGRATLLDDGRVLVASRASRTEHAGGGALVTLDAHHRAVAGRADRVAAAVALSAELRGSLLLAACHHDEGKRDPRFQAWLRGGSPGTDEPLAKGAYPYDPVRVRRLREASGWPAGKRHELLSAVAVALAHPDDSLAAWLVATHHGHNRPFLMAVEDAAPGLVSVPIEGRMPRGIDGAAAPSLSTQLGSLVSFSDRFGPWGLAYLEALLISADRAVSAAEGAS